MAEPLKNSFGPDVPERIGDMAILGYERDSPAVIARTSCTPTRLRIGGKVRMEVEIENPSTDDIEVLIDLRVHFVKAKGKHTPGARVRDPVNGCVDCGRFEWSVLDWNEPSRKFYESFGAQPQSEWIGYRLAGDSLSDLARG
jgi:hypothetical protein